MKPLSHEQFRKRFTPPPPHESGGLTDQLDSYSAALSRWDLASIMSTQVPLLLTHTLPPNSKLRDRGELKAAVLSGFRVIEVDRKQPLQEEVVAAYSPLTGFFHRTSWMSWNHVSPHLPPTLGVRGFTQAGHTFLRVAGIGSGTGSLTDHQVRLSLALELVSYELNIRVAWDFARHGSDSGRVLTDRLMSDLAGLTKLEAPPPRDGGVPAEERQRFLCRVLGQDRGVLGRIWEVVDLYGYPEGDFGAALLHMDKFRTL
jgi:hypothetical protein